MATRGYGEVRSGRLRRRGARSGEQSLPWTLPVIAADTRLRYAGVCIALGLAVGMLLSPNLWLTRPASAALAESFPMVAPVSGMVALAPPPPFDALFLGAVLALCALAAVVPRRAVFAALFFACLLLAAPDVMRWQPWTFLYLGIAGTLAFVPERTVAGVPHLLAWVQPLTVLRILVASVYLYSGFNKLNASFFEEQLGGFLAGMQPLLSSGPAAAALTYSAPVLEMAAGAGLLAGGLRIRHVALTLAAGTNLFVLAALVSAGANLVVWPWNLAMIGLVVALFAARDKEPQKAPRSLTRAHPAAHTGRLWGYLYAGIVFVFFAAMPLVGVFGYWPSYLSFALYSANTSEASVAVEGDRASVTQMSYESLGVPAYPAQKVYEVLGERACASGQVSENVLVVRERPDVLTGSRESRAYSCTPIGLVEELEGAAHSP